MHSVRIFRFILSESFSSVERHVLGADALRADDDVRRVRREPPRHARLPPVGDVRILPAIWSRGLRRLHLRIEPEDPGLLGVSGEDRNK